MEVLGSGMVNRKVIEFGGLDPDEWQGFAFGTGVDRLAMLKYGLDDLRASSMAMPAGWAITVRGARRAHPFGGVGVSREVFPRGSRPCSTPRRAPLKLPKARPRWVWKSKA
jgi:hypothetical protein